MGARLYPLRALHAPPPLRRPQPGSAHLQNHAGTLPGSAGGPLLSGPRGLGRSPAGEGLRATSRRGGDPGGGAGGEAGQGAGNRPTRRRPCEARSTRRQAEGGAASSCWPQGWRRRRRGGGAAARPGRRTRRLLLLRRRARCCWRGSWGRRWRPPFAGRSGAVCRGDGSGGSGGRGGGQGGSGAPTSRCPGSQAPHAARRAGGASGSRGVSGGGRGGGPRLRAGACERSHRR